MSDRAYCIGCRDDFYNAEGSHMSKNGKCWMLDKANVVTRYRINWWTRPDQPKAFQQVRTHHCHSAPGKYAHYEKLPDFAVEPIRDEP